MTTIEQDQDFQTSVDVDADPDSVFQALTTTTGVSGWWAPASGDGSTGGDLDFAFGEHIVRFRVLAADHPNRVRWQAVDCDVLPDWVGTTISFDLTPTPTGTTVHFRHTGLTPQLPCYQQCSTDWGRYLHTSLADYLQTGTGHPVGADKPGAPVVTDDRLTGVGRSRPFQIGAPATRPSLVAQRF